MSRVALALLAGASMLLSACQTGASQDHVTSSSALPGKSATTEPEGSDALLEAQLKKMTAAGASTPLSVKSPAFAAGGPIPMRYSCKGSNISPPLNWSGGAKNATSYALSVEDPDAPRGTFIHWILYNIPASTHGLKEAVPPSPTLPDGAMQGTNSAGKVGYTGPCPPSGVHHYHFKLYGLDTILKLPSGANRDQLVTAARGHIVAEGELIGTFAH